MRALEIGPGKDPVSKDWDLLDMVDRPNLTYKHDLRKLPLPIENNTYDLVYMSHILEHIPWTKTIETLEEIRRILKPGGTVEIWVPDLAKLVGAYLNPERVKMDGWYKFNEEKDPVRWFNGRLFTYGPGEENWHRAAFDEPYLRRCLKKAGFKNQTKLESPRGYDHGWINLGIRGEK